MEWKLEEISHRKPIFQGDPKDLSRARKIVKHQIIHTASIIHTFQWSLSLYFELVLKSQGSTYYYLRDSLYFPYISTSSKTHYLCEHILIYYVCRYLPSLLSRHTVPSLVVLHTTSQSFISEEYKSQKMLLLSTRVHNSHVHASVCTY